MADSRNRQPKGVSTGGQYATETRGEAEGLSLASPAPTPSVQELGAAYLRAEELRDYADRIPVVMSPNDGIQRGCVYYLKQGTQYGLPEGSQKSATDTIKAEVDRLAGYGSIVTIGQIRDAHNDARRQYQSALADQDRESYPRVATPPTVVAGFAEREFTQAAAEFHNASELKDWADTVRADHPGADRIHLSGRFTMGPGGQEVISETRRRRISDPAIKLLAPYLADKEGFVSIEEINSLQSSSQKRYSRAMTRAMLPDTNSSTLYKVPKLPVALPEGWRIATVDDVNGVTASLVGPGHDAVMNVWLNDEGEAGGDQVGVGPDWLEEHGDEIFETLRATAMNRESISGQLRGGLLAITGMAERIDALCSGNQ
ncbi:hypothetical protein LG293_16610 (plasmid) [Citricoccus nitrophenolicus]